MEQAEAGRWGELVDNLWLDISAARAERERRGTVPNTAEEDDAWLRTAEQAIVNTLDGNVKGGARKLRPVGVHSPSEETFKLLRSKFRTAAEDDTLANRADLVLKAKNAKPTRIAARAAHKAVDRLQLGKAPGASGWKASYIKPLIQHPKGLTALCAWTRMWGKGAIHESCAQRWRALLAIPLKKGDTALMYEQH